MNKIFAVSTITLSLISTLALAGQGTQQSGRRIDKQIGYEYLSRYEAEAACSEAMQAVEAAVASIEKQLPGYNVSQDLSVKPFITLGVRSRGMLDPMSVFPAHPGQPGYPGFPGNSTAISSWVYYCDLVFKNKNPAYELKSIFFDKKLEKGNTDCSPVFEELLGGKALAFVHTSERKALFSRRTVCNAAFVELVAK